MFYKVWLRLLVLAGAIVGILLSVVYQRIRRPGWAPTADKIKVPYAGWIIAAIIVFALACLLFLALRDPLNSSR
jgi:hypothetical protein